MEKSLFRKIALITRWPKKRQRALARQSQIEAKRFEGGAHSRTMGDDRESIWRSRSKPFVSFLASGLLTSALLLLAACATGAIMTRSDFDNIEMGTPVSEIVQKYGDPIKVKDNKNGTESYEYIERLPIGEQTVQENNYYLIVRDGKVVGKRYNEELPQAFDELYEEDPNAVIN